MGTTTTHDMLLQILALAMIFAVARSTGRHPHPRGLRVDLARIDSAGNFSKLELLRRAAHRSHHRMSKLIARTTTTKAAAESSSSSSQQVQVQAPVHAGNGEFLMDLAIGTPAVPFPAILDTGSDLIWTQCKPCADCFSQSTPIFDPSASSTFSKLPCSSAMCEALPTYSCATSTTSDCDYLYSYGDSSSTQGVLASETLTFGSATKVGHVAFGCGDTNEGDGFSQGAGLVGLGRGPLSLISQLGQGKFSYCLTSLDSTKKSPLLFGSLADLSSGASSSTPLVKNPSQASFYYLTLKGITVGATPLQIPSSTFALQEDGTGGLIIDSGTSITYLDNAGYKPLKKAFAAQMQLPVADGSAIGLDLCFSLPSSGSSSGSSVEVPKLVLHFDGADLDLPADNYMIGDSSSGLLCLTVMGSRGMSILGNFQQQNMQMLYDLDGGRLSFAPAHCDKL